MARLAAVANGNNTSSSTWALIDSTSYLESESSAITAPTSYTTTYNQFTPGAIEIDGIGTRLANRTGTTGTFSIELYNHTAAASVAGTEVTINCSDFNDAITGSLDGGWYFFKFGSPVTLLAANAYSVRFKTSNATQIVIHGTSSTAPSRYLRTTTTQAPAAGDDMIVTGEWTAASTVTTRTVTINDTSVTDYGSGSTSLVLPALSIGNNGVVNVGTSASTDYVYKISGNTIIYNGGALRIASSGSRMPTTSSFTWTTDSVVNVDFGIIVRRKGECKAFGESKTRWTLLTADEASSSTVINVVSTSGWKAGDTLLFPSTSQTQTHTETRTISTVDSSTQVTISSGLTNAHSGTGDMVGEVGNLTSNVRFLGTSSSVGYYFLGGVDAIVELDNVECQQFGSGTTQKRGIESISTTSGGTNTFILNSSAFHTYSSTGTTATVGNVQTTASYVYITDSVFFPGFTNSPIGITMGTSGSISTSDFEISGNLVCNNIGTSFAVGINIGVYNDGTTGIVSNNRIAAFAGGVSISTSNINTPTLQQIGKVTFEDCIIHSCNLPVSSTGVYINRIFNNCQFIHNSWATGNITGNIEYNNCDWLGNQNAYTNSIQQNVAATLITFNGCTFRGTSFFNQSYGIRQANFGQSPIMMVFNECIFGDTVAHTTADFSLGGMLTNNKIILNSCTFNSTTEIDSAIPTTYLDDRAYVSVIRKDNTDGANTLYINQGVVTPDTAIYRTASPSIKISPTSATITATTKLFPFTVPVSNGQTVTPSVYVRESVVGDGTDYNGNRIRLYVAQNINLGIASDTLLDTATASSEGAWEQLTGTTSAVTDDGVLEFYLTCDGTTGWINYDDITATTA